MKPKTKIQKKVARLSANLRPISATQIDWAYRHCIEHIGYRTKKGNITCSDCGHEWYSNSVLCDTLEGCTCPKCYAKLKVQDTRKRIYKETQYFSVITTCKGYQVIRVAQVRCESRKGEPMHFYCHEVVQRWISPDGKVTDMALLRGFTFYYCDVWALCSAMEIRPHNSLYDDVVARSCAYPKMRVLPQLRRNGFKGDFHGISPVRLFKALLSDPRIETLMKGDEIEVMKHFLFNARTADECWASYLIAKRHKYRIDNFSMWCDYLRMLNKLGQDLRNPKNICPEDFMAAHDNATRKIEAIHERNSNPSAIIPKASWLERLDNLLKLNICNLGKKFETLKKGLIKCRDYIFNFLEDPMIPSDNNGSERGIRKLKIKLKNSCTFRSDFGADAFLELHSIVETAKKHNKTPFNAIQALFEA